MILSIFFNAILITNIKELAYMRTELISSNIVDSAGYGAGSGNIEHYEYKCPCGKSTIVEEHDNIPGFREHDVYICCDECRKNYELDTSKGVRSWDLKKRVI